MHYLISKACLPSNYLLHRFLVIFTQKALTLQRHENIHGGLFPTMTSKGLGSVTQILILEVPSSCQLGLKPGVLNMVVHYYNGASEDQEVLKYVIWVSH